MTQLENFPVSDEKILSEYRQMDGVIGCTMTQRKVRIGDKEITERDFHPVFIDEEARLRAKQRIERNLYKIFSKYREKFADE